MAVFTSSRRRDGPLYYSFDGGILEERHLAAGDDGMRNTNKDMRYQMAWSKLAGAAQHLLLTVDPFTIETEWALTILREAQLAVTAEERLWYATLTMPTCTPIQTRQPAAKKEERPWLSQEENAVLTILEAGPSV